MNADLFCVIFSLLTLSLCLCNPLIDTLLTFFREERESLDLIFLDGLVDDGAESFFVIDRIADHDLLVNLAHLSLVLCVGGKQSFALLVTAFVLFCEFGDSISVDGVCPLSTVEIAPVEDVVFDVKRFVSPAGVVVAGAAAGITQDGVCESDFLELCVCDILVLRLGLVLEVSVK